MSVNLSSKTISIPYKQLVKENPIFYEIMTTIQSILHASETLLLYGTDDSNQFFLPENKWTKSEVLTVKGRVFDFIPKAKVKFAKFKWGAFPIQNNIPNPENNNELIENYGIVPYLLNRHNDFFIEDIMITFVPNVQDYLPKDGSNKFFAPIWGYRHGEFIYLDDVQLRADIIKAARSKNFLTLPVLNFGALEINNAEPELFIMENSEFVNKQRLIKKFDQVIKIVKDFLPYINKLSNEHKSEEQLKEEVLSIKNTLVAQIDELNKREEELNKTTRVLRKREEALSLAEVNLEIKREELLSTQRELSAEQQAKEKISRNFNALQADVKNNLGFRSTLHDTKSLDNRMIKHLNDAQELLAEPYWQERKDSEEYKRLFSKINEVTILAQESRDMITSVQHSIKGERSSITAQYSLSMVLGNCQRKLIKELNEAKIDFSWSFHTGEENDVMVPWDVYSANRRFDQLTLNAVDRMLRFAPERENKFIRIYTEQKNVKRNKDDNETSPFLIIHVTDNGPGVPDERKKDIFELNRSDKDEGGEHGVFLHTLRNELMRDGGFIKEIGVYGEGAHFIIGVPMISKDKKRGQSSLSEKGAFVIDERVRGKNILLADDEMETLNLHAEILKNAGFSVETAKNGYEVLEKLQAGYPADLVVSDLEMTIMGADKMITKIQENNFNIRVVIVSNNVTGDDGEPDLEVLEGLVNHGDIVADVIPKSTDMKVFPPKLLERVQNVLLNNLK